MTRKILALFAIVTIVYFFVQVRNQDIVQAPQPEPEFIQESAPEKHQEIEPTNRSEESSATAGHKPSIDVNQSQVLEAAAKAFPDVLKALGACFDIRNQVGADRIEPNLSQLIDSLRGELGDSIAEYEDWSNEHITMPNGEQRRLRIENGADTNGIPGRFLRYFKLDKEGLPEAIPLQPEQSQNPTDEILSSLRGDGKRSFYERNLRSYFQNGEEVVTTEKNGLLVELDMAKGAKTFKCSGLNSASPNCRCSDY